MEPKIIFVAGGSASGKTTLSRQIIDHFKNRAILVAQDSFYRGSRHSNVNFDLPSSMDFKLMKKTLLTLKKGQKVQIPIYDFVAHQAVGQTWLEPKEIVIFEGLFTFYDPELTKLADFKIFVDTPADTRLWRRIIRDTKERGRSLDSVGKRWLEHVQPSYEKFISPTKKDADVVIPWDKIKARSIEALLITIHHIGDDYTKLLAA